MFGFKERAHKRNAQGSQWFKYYKEGKCHTDQWDRFHAESPQFVSNCKKVFESFKNAQVINLIADQILKGVGIPQKITIHSSGLTVYGKGIEKSISFGEYNLRELNTKKYCLSSFPNYDMVISHGGLYEWFDEYKQVNKDIFGLYLCNTDTYDTKYVVYLSECAVVGCVIAQALGTEYMYTCDAYFASFEKKSSGEEWK